MDFIRGHIAPYLSYDFGPIKLPGLSRNGPLELSWYIIVIIILLYSPTSTFSMLSWEERKLSLLPMLF